MGRKEYTEKKGILTTYYQTTLYGTGKDYGKKAVGIGNTKDESIERAYKEWREKYGYTK